MGNGNMKSGFAAALLAVAAFSSPTVQAGDGKVFNGGSCQAYYGAQERDIHKYPTGAYNWTYNSRWISCPLVRDRMFSYAGTDSFWVRIEQPGWAKTTCYLREMHESGVTRQVRSAARWGSGYLNLDTGASGRKGPRSLYCLLGPRAKLVKYEMWEFMPTGNE